MSKELTFDEKVHELVRTRGSIARLQRAEYELNREIVAEMESDDAKIRYADSPSGAGKLKVSLKESQVSWDNGKLAQLREITAPESLVGIYTPAHTKTVDVKEKWNMNAGRKLRNFGRRHIDIIDSARIVGRKKVEIDIATTKHTKGT